MTKKESKSPSWSFSSLKAFQNCPKQYYHTKVLKQHPVEETEAIRYGSRFHKAAEEYIRDGVMVPSEFAWAKATLDSLSTELDDLKAKLPDQAKAFTDSKVALEDTAKQFQTQEAKNADTLEIGRAHV